jgi:glycosyltransferase involved in cell wall biosynthesis
MAASISAVIPTKNVAGFIRPTLESLRFCDEVVIVDMFSSDDSRAVCESYPNVRFYQRQDFIYGNFNFGAEQATGDWILRIDSDEVVSPDLRESIQEVLADPDPKFLHYNAFCHLYFFGMRLRNGFGDQWRTMIFKMGTAHYLVQNEHEGLTLTGPAGRLRGNYDHFTNPTLSAWLAKANYYSDRNVERQATRTPLPPWRIITNLIRYFRGSYFGKGGLRKDGYLGFVVALVVAFDIAILELKMWEKHEKATLKASGRLPDHPNANS